MFSVIKPALYEWGMRFLFIGLLIFIPLYIFAYFGYELPFFIWLLLISLILIIMGVVMIVKSLRRDNNSIDDDNDSGGTSSMLWLLPLNSFASMKGLNPLKVPGLI
jgi:putative Mn2+ efflux pump MntP